MFSSLVVEHIYGACGTYPFIHFKYRRLISKQDLKLLAEYVFIQKESGQNSPLLIFQPKTPSLSTALWHVPTDGNFFFYMLTCCLTSRTCLSRPLIGCPLSGPHTPVLVHALTALTVPPPPPTRLLVAFHPAFARWSGKRPRATEGTLPSLTPRGPREVLHETGGPQ